MKRATLTDYAIGYRYMPEPPDDSAECRRDDAISSRFDQIWDDADLLHGALHDADLPFTLHTATLFRDCARRLCGNEPTTDAETFVLALADDLRDAVHRAAVADIDNVDWEP